MERLTEYDEVAECYKLKPDANVNIIQQLGRYEELMEHGYLVFRNKGAWEFYWAEKEKDAHCPFCQSEFDFGDAEVEPFEFCPRCGADMKGREDDENKHNG